MNSLRLRLVFLLSIGLSVAWLVAAWFTHAESQSEINRLFDAQLAQSAQVLLGTTSHELHERIEHGEDEISVSHEYEQKLNFQIWSGKNLLVRSTGAPTRAMADVKEGYSDAIINDQSLRVFTRWDTHHEFMIQVAEPFAGRESLARHITFKMLIPTFIMLPILTVLIWFGVGAGLKPLQQLKQEVKQRAPNRLESLSMENVPEEVTPLVQALNNLFSRLQEAFESERRFTADAAHELRTPLAALKTQAQVALRSSDELERRTALDNILRGVDRATRLVSQLLTLARVDPEKAVTSYKLVDLHVLAAKVMVDLESLAHLKKIEFILEEGSDCNVFGDEDQLGLLIRNLLDNAIRYTPLNGRVSLTTLKNADNIVLEVRDTGCGIPKTERDNVLKRFYRVPGSKEDGSGLGLSIVQRIAELHGAKLLLDEDDVGHGLLVKVVWPLH